MAIEERARRVLRLVEHDQPVALPQLGIDPHPAAIFLAHQGQEFLSCVQLA